MEKSKLDVTSGLSWIGSVLQYVKDYGIWGIVKACFTLVFISFMLQIVYNPGFLVEKYTEYMNNRHAEELMERSKYDQKIKSLMPTLLYKYQADRIWIIQYHNGTMDWQHGTMRFELCVEGTESIKKQYDNFSLTWLDLPYYLQENEIFIGDISSLSKIDPIMCHQFMKNHVGYLACTLIRDMAGRPMAVFGATWSSVPDVAKYRHKIHDYLLTDRGEIKALLEATKIDK